MIDLSSIYIVGTLEHGTHKDVQMPCEVDGLHVERDIINAISYLHTSVPYMALSSRARA
jgi:hypothetical protein